MKVGHLGAQPSDTVAPNFFVLSVKNNIISNYSGACGEVLVDCMN